MGERWAAIKAAGPVILLMLAVFGGLYSGIFTVTEAASVAAVLSLLFALARGRLNWTTLCQGLRESAAATGMIYVMIMGALIFTYFLESRPRAGSAGRLDLASRTCRRWRSSRRCWSPI